MPEINYIRHIRENEEHNISEIARKCGINWRTAKKYADGDIPVSGPPRKRRGMMYTGGYGKIVDSWLEEDSKEKRKFRRNNIKIFEQLKAEHGFSGSYRTVCDYIKRRKPELTEMRNQRYERLEHPPGEAQVDFGTSRVIKDGAFKEIHALHLSFPYSNAGFVYPLPAQNSECFLEGLQQLFHQAGGVPTVLRIDNLSAAVIAIGRGEKRTYTDTFLAFQAHYGFKIQPCNPGSGHEKGNVEKKVGYSRQRWFVPEPVMEDFAQLSEWLYEQSVQDRDRPHYKKETRIEDLWQEEQQTLKHLPAKSFPVNRHQSVTVNKYGEITLDQEQVLIPRARPRQSLTLQKTWDTFTCFTDDGEILYKASRPYMDKSMPIPWEDIFKHWSVKPRSVVYSRYFAILPEPMRAYIMKKPEEMKERLMGLYEWLVGDYPMTAITALFEQTIHEDLSPYELRGLLEAQKATLPKKWEESHTPSILVDMETDLQTYDKMLCPMLMGGMVDEG